MVLFTRNVAKEVFILSCAFLLGLSTPACNLTLFGFFNFNSNSGGSIIGASWIAIQEINNNPNLLPNFKLHLEVYDDFGDPQSALLVALNMTKKYENSDEDNIYFPIVLGPTWSSISTTTGIIYAAHDMGHISAGATSIALSDTGKFPYFYRYLF